ILHREVLITLEPASLKNAIRADGHSRVDRQPARLAWLARTPAPAPQPLLLNVFPPGRPDQSFWHLMPQPSNLIAQRLNLFSLLLADLQQHRYAWRHLFLRKIRALGKFAGLGRTRTPV
ncbi:MAG: hypothetical protein ACREVG_10035, partial [Burkholderiales bacterium]